MFELFLILKGMILGFLVGLVCGLVPGIHPNLVNILIISFVPVSDNPFILSFIVSIAITNIIINYIPTVFLGVPESGTELSILPAHDMVLSGMSLEAIRLFIIGSIGGLVFSLYLSIFGVIVSKLYPIISEFIWLILVLFSCFFILKEDKKKIAFAVFVMSGLIGIFSQKLPINSDLILFPMLTGLFGIPILITSYSHNTEIPKQDKKMKVSKTTIYNSVITGSLAGFLTSILPGISASAAAFLSSKSSRESYLIKIGSIQMINTLFSFFMIYLIGKSRSGSAVVLKQFMDIGFQDIKLIFVIAAIMIFVSSLTTFELSKYFSKIIHKISYKKTSFVILLFITSIVVYLTGIYGLFLFILCSFLGFIPITNNISRVHMMGCIIIPVIVYFL